MGIKRYIATKDNTITNAFQVDYTTKFEKDIVKPLKHLCNIMNWIPFNPNEQTAQNIFDL